MPTLFQGMKKDPLQTERVLVLLNQWLELVADVGVELRHGLAVAREVVSILV